VAHNEQFARLRCTNMARSARTGEVSSLLH